MRKFLIFAVLAAIVGFVGWKFVTSEAKQKPDRRRGNAVVAVETVRIGHADLGDRAVFTGTVRANERYDAAPKIAGIIKRVNFDIGDIVHKGDVIAVLDDDEYHLAVDQAEARVQVAQASVDDARAQLAITQRDHNRNSALHQERVISAQELDRIDATLTAQESRLDTAIAEMRLAEAELRTAEVKLGYTRVVADWDGADGDRIIGFKYLDAGNMAATHTPIVSVIDIDAVKAIVPVNEKELPRIRMGDAVDISTDAFPGRVFPGRVARIAQEFGELSREAEVEIAVANPEHTLKPGMFIRASIEYQRRDDAVAAPLAAVIRRDDGRRGVYLVNDARDAVSFHPVSEGITDGDFVELVDAGDLLNREVVTLGQHLLKDGMAIRIADDLSFGKGDKPVPAPTANPNNSATTTGGA